MISGLSTRRDFLKNGTLLLSMFPLAGLSSSLFADEANDFLTSERRTLVVVRLAGGNDGLNTVVPYADPAYARLRPTLAIDPAAVLPLTARVGLHPSLTGLKTLFDRGELAVIQGVGADDLPPAHKTATRFWNSGQLDGHGGADYWLRWPISPQVVQADGWASRFATVAAAIQSERSLQVHHLNLAGFDTHAGQSQRHAYLLKTLDESLVAFRAQLARQGDADRVMIVVYSEFGRTAEENSMGGTDHGSAGPVLVIGSHVRGGVIGEQPALADDGSALRAGIDFRAVYADLLGEWLGVSVPAQLRTGAQRVSIVAARV